jgi:uncharacterized protein YoaH (UPF0181 family)
MSDEMVTLTSDSPAEATDGSGMREAFVNFVDSNAGDQQEEQRATSSEPVTDDLNDSYLENLLGMQEQPGNVPYERFREVNERAKQASQYSEELDSWRSVIDEFKAQGFNSGADIQAALEAQRQEAEEVAIRERYDSLQNANLLDAQSAYAQQEAEITKLRYERQMAQVQEYMISQQTSQAMQSFPLAQRAPDLVNNLVASGVDPGQAAQFVHEQVKAIAKTLVPELTNKLVNTAPTPIQNGQSAANTQAPTQPGTGLSTLTRLLGISRNQNSL